MEQIVASIVLVEKSYPVFRLGYSAINVISYGIQVGNEGDSLTLTRCNAHYETWKANITTPSIVEFVQEKSRIIARCGRFPAKQPEH